MVENSYVIVIPSKFAQKHTSTLIQNIKNILKIKNLQYKTIKKDGQIIIVDANDPVFTSSAINLLFGIEKVAIAKQVKNNFSTIISEISKIGSNLLLKGDTFYVKVDGIAKGYVPKDLELAATSAIIEKASKMDAHPGTEENHNKLLYTFLTKSNAYICIFSDKGLGGIPYGVQKETILCGIYDELSAISCIETIKQGFNVEIIVHYSNDTELKKLVKMLNQILPRMVSKKIDLEFFKINFDKINSKNYFSYIQSVFSSIEKIASKRKIKCVSLPITPLIFPSKLIGEICIKFYQQKILPYLPLGALEDEIFRNAKEVGLGKFIQNIEKLIKINFDSIKSIKDIEKNNLPIISKKITVQVGPNNVHEILDELIEEGKN